MKIRRSYFFPKGPTNHQSALVELMAWCQTRNKPLSKQMMTHLMHKYAPRPHTEAETKWPQFSRQHFQIDFVNENV